MPIDYAQIAKVRAAKGNPANTNPNAGKTYTRTPTTRRSRTTPRKATAAEKARYASRARYVPRPSSGTAGIPSWASKPVGTRNGVKIYNQPRTKTYYFQRNNTVYRYDERNNRFYLLDNGVISAGRVVPRASLPSWVKAVLWN